MTTIDGFEEFVTKSCSGDTAPIYSVFSEWDRGLWQAACKWQKQHVIEDATVIAIRELENVFTHRLAVNLECMLLDPVQSYNAALELIGEYHDAMSKIRFDAGEYSPTYQQLEVQNTKYREVLEILAKLGNEPNYGNSDGNCIAQDALK